MDTDTPVILAYLRYAETQEPQDFWAWKEVSLAPYDNPQKCFRLVLKLIEAATSRDQIGFVASGPLESLLDLFPNQTIEQIDQEIPQNLRLIYALRWVWNDDDPVDAYLAQLEASYGEELFTPEALKLTSEF